MAGLPPAEPYSMPAEADLPRNTAGWTLDARRTVLLIHDMQQYFVRPVPAPEPATALLHNITALRQACIEQDVPIAYTAQRGGMNPQERGLLKDFWGPGMQLSEHDRQIVGPLAPSPRDWLFTKHRYSAFHRSDLAERMATAGRDQLVVCGVYAYIGVLATVIDAFSRDIEVFLAADAIADFTAADHHLALRYAAGRCAVVQTTAALTGWLHATGTVPIGGRP